MITGLGPDAEGHNQIAAAVRHQLRVVERPEHFVFVASDDRVDVGRAAHHASFITSIAAVFLAVFVDVFQHSAFGLAETIELFGASTGRRGDPLGNRFERFLRCRLVGPIELPDRSLETIESAVDLFQIVDLVTRGRRGGKRSVEGAFFGLDQSLLDRFVDHGLVNLLDEFPRTISEVVPSGPRRRDALAEQPALLASVSVLMPSSGAGVPTEELNQRNPKHQFRSIGSRSGPAICLVQVVQVQRRDGLAGGLHMMIVLELFFEPNELLTARLQRCFAKWCFFERRTWLSLASAFWIFGL